MPPSRPLLPLPPPIRSITPGTWAHETMSSRIRKDILPRILRENNLDPSSIHRLETLDHELVNAATTELSPLPRDGGPDVDLWNSSILSEALASRETWLSAPWVVAEFYLYRRIISAIDYFGSPMDPFRLQKELGLTTAIASIGTLAVRVNAVLSKSSVTPAAEKLQQLRGFVLTALWGNRMDLSLWPVGGSSEDRATDAFASVLEAGQRMILANDVDALIAYVGSWEGGGRVDVVVDNAGFELFCDLCMADFLVQSGLVDKVCLQLKAHPTFVSDAMAKDVRWTVEFLKRADSAEVRLLGERWGGHIEAGKWVMNEDYFWVQPQPMWEMPQALKSDLGNGRLVFVKGDANYRRLIGERDWELDAPFNSILAYFPAPVCALRTLKAELGCGMETESVKRAMKEDEKWMVAGKYGVVQFCNTREIEESQLV